MKWKVYRCVAPLPYLPEFPLSVRVNKGWNSFRWPPETGYMSPDQGDGCPTYLPREKSIKQGAK